MSAAEAAPDEVGVRLCGPADRAAQAALYDICFEKSDGATVVPWRYDRNPHGRAITLVATDSGGVGLSGYACSPRVVLHRGSTEGGGVVGQTGDVMTHPDHRGKGLFSDLDRRALAEAARAGWPVVFGLPNRRSALLVTTCPAVASTRPWRRPSAVFNKRSSVLLPWMNSGVFNFSRARTGKLWTPMFVWPPKTHNPRSRNIGSAWHST